MSPSGPATGRPDEGAPEAAAVVGRLRRLALLFVVLAAAGAGSLSLGATVLPPSRIWHLLFASGTDDPLRQVLVELRIPRVVLGGLVGAALSISGALLQAFFQNPMAGPYVVGVSAGAGLFAVAAMTLGLAFRFGPFGAVPLAAFAGGLFAVGLVQALAGRVRFLRSEGLLLIGIAVGSVFSALTSILLLFSRDGVQGALFWMMGTLSSADWTRVTMVAWWVAAAGLPALFLSRDLNLLLWGDDVATSLGSAVPRVRRWILVLSSLLAAASVAACGVIGFVGLMVPHVARGLLRTNDHRFVLPGSAAVGAVLVIVADAFARAVWAPSELPIGAVTSALGAPFLVWLVVRRHRRF